MIVRTPSSASKTLPPLSETPLVSLKQIGLRLQGQEILSHINFDLNAGHIVTVIGPNGAGKTTLVNIILGLRKPSQGSVVRIPNLRMGYMPQRLSLDRTLPLTVRRFLSLGNLSLGTQEAPIQEALQQVCALKLIDQSIHVLSGGEFQRVLLAKAILRDPQLLILDEPGQGVDPQGQVDFYLLIQQVRDHLGCGVLLVSHDLHFVHAASDQVICLNGHICCMGSPREIQTHPEYQALFGQIVPLGLAPYRHTHDHRHDPPFDPLSPREEG